MSSKDTGCTLCRYVKARPWDNTSDFFCVCENSPLFAKNLGIKGECPGCDCFEKGKYSDMSLLDAMKIITSTPRSQEEMNKVGPYPMVSHRLNLEDRPLLTMVFETNEQLEDWRDANCRIFAEVMRLMKENGEFEDAE